MKAHETKFFCYKCNKWIPGPLKIGRRYCGGLICIECFNLLRGKHGD